MYLLRRIFTIVLTASCLAGCSSLESSFNEEVAREMRNAAQKRSSHINAGDSQNIITENDIQSLPLPVRRYFRYSNFIGQEKPVNAKVEWKNAALKRAPDAGWLPLECTQYNFVPEPSRIVYMNSAIWGIFPFQGKDKYQDGHGNMYIRLMNMMTIGDFKSVEMDRSALVTILAEVPMVPSYALQEYVQWAAVDSLTANATITFNNTSVSGTFHFKESGEFYRFDTKDRFMTSGDSVINYPWSASVRSYKETNGIRHPSIVSAEWHTENGEYQYWKGEIVSIQYNVRPADSGK